MPTISSADQILERHYLEIRCGLLDLGAALDRIERADGAGKLRDDDRLQRLKAGLKILCDDEGDRAERIQLLFSDEYAAGWNR